MGEWGGEVGARPSPSWEHKLTISIWRAFSPSYGGFFLHMKDLFSPFGGHCFSLNCTVFGGYFLHARTIFLLTRKAFQACPHLQKLLRVVASVAHSGNLREIARLNIFVNTFYSTFSRNAGKTNEMIRC